jgi:hypothetical protein
LEESGRYICTRSPSMSFYRIYIRVYPLYALANMMA